MLKCPVSNRPEKNCLHPRNSFVFLDLVGTRVTIGADEDGIQDITVYGETVCDFNCIFQAKVQIGDHVLSMIDYASAGKTWDEASRMEAWIHC